MDKKVFERLIEGVRQAGALRRRLKGLTQRRIITVVSGLIALVTIICVIIELGAL